MTPAIIAATSSGLCAFGISYESGPLCIAFEPKSVVTTLGETIEMAYRRALNLEDAAQNTYRCLQLGDRETAFPGGVELAVHQ